MGTLCTKTYKPVIRTEPTGSNRVTWAEFVEAGLLRQYRRATTSGRRASLPSG